MMQFLTPPAADLADGWLALNGDRLALLGILAAVRPKVMVQVGVWQAKDIAAFLQVLPGLVIHGIDCDPKPEAASVPFHLVKEVSSKCLRDVLTDTKPDLVYIDGDHSYGPVMQDMKLAIEHAPQAVIVGHDYRCPDVFRAVQDVRKTCARPFREVWTEPLYVLGGSWGSLWLCTTIPTCTKIDRAAQKCRIGRRDTLRDSPRAPRCDRHIGQVQRLCQRLHRSIYLKPTGVVVATTPVAFFVDPCWRTVYGR